MDRQGSVWILPFWNMKVDEDMEFVTILEDWKGGLWGLGDPLFSTSDPGSRSHVDAKVVCNNGI